MNAYHAWTPDAGTTELPSIHRGRALHSLETVELSLLDLHPPSLPPTRRPVRFTRPARKVATFLAVVLGCLILSASPVKAHPVHDAPKYYGPTLTCHVAGVLFPWAVVGGSC